MKPVRTFKVRPVLPQALGDLYRVAANLRWAWDHETIELFRRLDSDLWESSGHNPIRMLGLVEQEKLDAAARDDAFLAHLGRVAADLDGYVATKSTWYGRTHSGTDSLLVAYFSAEFGITECLSIFAGGLGILAGDHLKAASDKGVPLVGVGLLYQQGYFRQYLNAAGWQQEAYEDNDFHNLPISPERTATGEALKIAVDLPDRRVYAAVWSTAVGRVKLILLDANINDNSPADRDITDQLYGGDKDMRIRQEIVLGIGGYRALAALGISPTVYHMNEGHSAFLALEHVRHLMVTRRLSCSEAMQAASASLVFTTHTPVAAGHDYFPPALVRAYFSGFSKSIGLGWSEFLALGRQNPADDSEPFCMTVLALKMAAASNGVSKLHGRVTRRMWSAIWPDVPTDEIPIGHVTNGVHFRSWVSYEMNQLYDRYLGPKWREEPSHPMLWNRIDSIPAEELWRTHERRRERLVAFARRRLRVEAQNRRDARLPSQAAEEALDPEILTIGFARRFAAYKRATLLLRNPQRLEGLLGDPHRPIQIIYAGKAHPRDDEGKDFIQRIVKFSRDSQFGHRLVFLEDYDMVVARYLVEGCDVWLNTPRRPLEASGTSGMKALANGVLNVSTLDGWWDEAWTSMAKESEPFGWAIGAGEEYADPAYQDQVEAEALYDLLEHEIAPLFYDRGRDGIPRSWVMRMKSSIRTLCPEFNMHRQVKEYTESFYLTAHGRFTSLTEGDGARVRALSAWLQGVRPHWSGVRIESVEHPEDFGVGAHISARARVRLPQLTPDDVIVELLIGGVDKQGEMTDTVAYPMVLGGRSGNDAYDFYCETARCTRSGLHGLTVRVCPSHPDLMSAFVPGLITWAGPSAVGVSA